MYTKHLPAELPENWVIAELDEENDYLEFLGFEGEFLVSIMKDTYENPDEPFHLVMNPLKGILSRYDFEKLNWPECFAKRKDAVQSAVELMVWMNQNYPNFDPVTLEIYVSVGTVDQLDRLQGFFLEKLSVHDFEGQPLVFRKVKLLLGTGDYAASAIEMICHFTKDFKLVTEEMKGGLLTNEKFELIEDLRPALSDRLKSQVRIATDRKIVHPYQSGQIARFHSPYPEENPNQLYLVKEIFDYGGNIKSKAEIKALNTGWSFPPINTVLLEDLEVAEVDTADLIGYKAAVIKEDGSKVTGRVIEAEHSKLVVNLLKIENRVETNVRVTVEDEFGASHQGALAVIF